MPDPIHVRGSVSIPESELGWRFSRSSGPGGQHVNTSATAAELSFDVANSPSLPEPLKARALDRLSHRLVRGVLTIRAEEYRSQQRNRDAARTRLATLLADATA
ncbi:aminoacyl-tRNA hydrolase, partial [Actinomadura darangshiensis]